MKSVLMDRSYINQKTGTAPDAALMRAIMDAPATPHDPDDARRIRSAVSRCRAILEEGRGWAVRMRFDIRFDTDRQQSRLAELLFAKGADRKAISLIHRHSRAGMPRGSRLCSFCADVMLEQLDAELARRGHRSVRHGQELAVLCGSRASARQALDHILPFIERKLFVSPERVDARAVPAAALNFLGYGFDKGRQGYRLRIHEESKREIKSAVRDMTSRRRAPAYDAWKGRIARFVSGLMRYYETADMAGFIRRTDPWMRRRVRMVILKRWKRVRTRRRRLGQLGGAGAASCACSRAGHWRLSGSRCAGAALTDALLAENGFLTFGSLKHVTE